MIFGTNINGEIVFGIQQCGIVSIDLMKKKRTNQQPKPSRIFGNDVQQRNV